jgi:hypothetical protein
MPTTRQPAAVALPDTAALDAYADPATFIITSCERAKAWLGQCLEGGHIEAIVETKAQAEAIRVYTMQKQLGKDAELSAAEIVRRAERCIGLAIRKGQESGTVARQGQNRNLVANEVSKVTDYVTYSDLSGSGGGPGFYDMADGVPDEQFESAIAKAKAEKDLSRTNVVRKVKGENGKADRWAPLAKMASEGHTSDQIAKEIGFTREVVARKAKALGIDIPADRVLYKSRRVNHNRVLSEFVNTLESLVPSVDLIALEKVDRAVLTESLGVMDEAMRVLGKFRRQLRGAVDGD